MQIYRARSSLHLSILVHSRASLCESILVDYRASLHESIPPFFPHCTHAVTIEPLFTSQFRSYLCGLFYSVKESLFASLFMSFFSRNKHPCTDVATIDHSSISFWLTRFFCLPVVELFIIHSS